MSKKPNGEVEGVDFKQHQIWWQVAALVAITTIAVFASNAFQERLELYTPETRPSASTYNKKPSGSSGCAELLARLGYSVQQWVVPYRQLRGSRGALIVINPSTSIREFEAKQILEWVEEGNDLIYLDHFQFASARHILQDLDLKAQDSIHHYRDKQVDVDQKNPEFWHVKQLSVSSESCINGGTDLIKVGKDTIFTTIKHGKGRVLIGSAPSFLANRRLGNSTNWSNFQFLANWLRTTNGDILFDERCHGYSEGGNIFVALAKSPAGPVAGQLLFILVVAIAGAANRFGATLSVQEKRKISNLEFISGLAGAYRKAGANHAVLQIMCASLRNRICRVLVLSPHEPTSTLIDSWERLYSTELPVRTFFSTIEKKGEDEKVSDQSFKRLTEIYDKIDRSLDEMSNSTHTVKDLQLT